MATIPQTTVVADPKSLKCKSFTKIYETKDGVINDDYIHSTFETWKFKAKTVKGSSIDYKAKFQKIEEGGDLNVKLDDEIKFKFSFANKYWAWFGARRGGDIKFHFDLGQQTIAKKEFNFFTNFKTTVNFKKFAFRFGVNYFGKKCESNTRLNWNNGEFWVTQRTFVRHNNFLYGFVGLLGLDCVIPCEQLIGYEKGDVSVYLQHTGYGENCSPANCCPSGAKKNKCPCSTLKLGELTATAVYKKNKYTFGGVFTRSFTKNTNCCAVAVEAQVNNDLKLKGKVGCCLNLELASVYKVNDLLTATTSCKLDFSKKAGGIDFKKVVPLPVGFQFELNV